MTRETGTRGSAVTTAMDDGVGVLTLDLPGESVNKFSRTVKAEFLAAFDALQADPAVRAIVITSGKKDMFVAGADIEEFVALRTTEEATRLSRDGQRMLDHVAAASKPVVAAVHGTCLGGGLELVLACQYRVATDHPRTVFGAPEVQLGIIPGAGGCNRLPRLVGLRGALEMILTGKNVRAAGRRPVRSCSGRRTSCPACGGSAERRRPASLPRPRPSGESAEPPARPPGPSGGPWRRARSCP